MSNFYDNSIVPNELKRNFDVYERIKELKIDLGPKDLSYVLEALRAHAKGGGGLPVHGSRDEIHAYCLDRLFEELVEEPSNILFTTKTGPDWTGRCADA